MKGRKRQQPEHESPHETRIVRAVEAAGVSDKERPFYLAFARELDLSLRWGRLGTRSEIVRRGQSPALRAPRSGTVPAISVMSPPKPQAPDFGIRTKRCVEKWFERGLSGHKLWLIGESLLRNPDSGTAFSTLHR